jgi:hypothetical protein
VGNVKYTLFAGFVALSGCGPSVAREPRPPAPAAPHEHAAAAPPFVPPRYAVGRGSYEVTSMATIQFLGDSSTRLDTLAMAVVIRYDASWTGTGLDFTGTVQSRVTAASARMQQASTESLDPVPFRASVNTTTSTVHLISSDSSEAADSVCPSPHAGALAVARQYLASIPRTLAPGDSWIDTTTATTCRGDIPVTTVSIRHFTVTLERATAPAPSSAPPVILVSHLSMVTMHGAVTHRGRAVTLTGSGSRHFDDRYDAFTGMLKSRTATTDNDITLAVAGAPPSQLREHVDIRTVPVTP